MRGFPLTFQGLEAVYPILVWHLQPVTGGFEFVRGLFRFHPMAGPIICDDRPPVWYSWS